jgi:methionyl-tRNA formyltransferase
MMVMKMDKGLDTGPVALTRTVPIPSDMTAGELHDALSEAGAGLMVEAMDRLANGDLPLTPQSGDGVLYAAKISKEEARIDFARDGDVVHNLIRGLSPFPGAWFEAEIGGKPERIKVLRSEAADGSGAPGAVLDERLTIACGRGAVRLLRLQRAGGKPLDAGDFLRGAPLAKGMRVS